MIIMNLLFIAFPYVAIATCILGSIYRYKNDQFSISSLSTQFMGSKDLGGLGANLWHVGLFLILSGHAISLLFTEIYQQIKESSAIIHFSLDLMRELAAGAVIIGLLLLIYRRLVNPRLRVITTPMDWIVLFLLLAQVVVGTYIFISHYSQPFWFADNVAPWFRGVFLLNPTVPDLDSWIIGFHILNPFFLLMLIPFSRLIHMFTFPVTYVWRPYQLVIWNRRN